MQAVSVKRERQWRRRERKNQWYVRAEHVLQFTPKPPREKERKIFGDAEISNGRTGSWPQATRLKKESWGASTGGFWLKTNAYENHRT